MSADERLASDVARRRLLWPALGLAIALNAAYGGLGGVLVPAQVALVDAGTKEVNLAIVMTTASLVTIVVSPLAGAASDGTRSRWGRRAPWIVTASVVAVPAALALGSARSVLALTIGWVLTQAALNVVQSPFEAAVADRVLPSERGRAGSILGVGVSLGLALGVVLAGQLVSFPLATGALLTSAVAVAAAVLVRRNPEIANAGSGLTSGLPTMTWPRRAPDFTRVFVGRFMLVLGNQLVSGYLLFILMDHLGLSREGAAATAGLVVTIHTGCIAVAAAVAGRFTDSSRRRKPFVVVASIVVACALLLPWLLPTVPAVLCYAVVAGLGRGTYLAVDTALMIDVLPQRRHTGRDLAILGLAQVVPQALTPLVAVGLLTLSHGDYGVLFAAALGLVLVSIVPVMRINSVR
ncbi:MFS transporter [Serinibacter arcticus]|nr:MFS transporter [Serinibacter arcticus]